MYINLELYTDNNHCGGCKLTKWAWNTDCTPWLSVLKIIYLTDYSSFSTIQILIFTFSNILQLYVLLLLLTNWFMAGYCPAERIEILRVYWWKLSEIYAHMILIETLEPFWIKTALWLD